MNLTIEELPLDEIIVDWEFNCRQEKVTPFDVRELAEDIEKHGLLQPIVVRPKKKGYQIVAGYRRYQAFKNLRRDKIPAIIREDLDETAARILNLSENLKRRNLNIMQEAFSLLYFFKKGYTREDIANELDVSTGWVQIRATVLQLPPEVQKAAAAGYLNQTQIKDLYSLHDKNKMFEAIRRIKDAKIKGQKIKNLVIGKDKKTKPTKKKKRDSREIFLMQDFVLDTLGPGLATRVLAWVGGIIDTQALLDDIMDDCETRGIEYRKPNWVE